MTDMQATVSLARDAAALMAKRQLEDAEVHTMASGQRMAAMVVAEIRAGAPQGLILALVGLLSQQDVDLMAALLMGIEGALRHPVEGAA